MLFCVGELQENCRDLLVFLNCTVNKLVATSERVIHTSPWLSRLYHNKEDFDPLF